MVISNRTSPVTLLRLGQGCSEQPRTHDLVREGQSGNRSPKIDASKIEKL
jgi:hypothetical protein